MRVPETRQKTAPQEDPVRVIDRNEVAHFGERPTDVAELERRVNLLQNDLQQVAGLAFAARASLDAGGLRIGAPPGFAAIGRFGPVAPGFVPPVPMPVAPSLLGWGAQVPSEAVTMKDFSALPSQLRAPGVNIVDVGEEFVVQVELPATKKKDLEILGNERALTVTAQVRPDADAEGTVVLGEVAPTVFRRTIALPAPCNTTRTRATLKDGVLTLSIPKKDPSSGMRRIDVAYG